MSRAAVVLAILVAASGCAPLSTLQSPRVLKEGQSIFGAAASVAGDPKTGDRHAALWDAFYRFPLQEGLDGGVRASGYPPYSWYVLSADVKHQLAETPRLMAVDAGVGVSLRGDLYAQSGLLYGSDSVFGGIRLIYQSVTRESEESIEDESDAHGGETMAGNTSLAIYKTGFLPGVVLGLSLGRDVRILPEISCYVDKRARFYVVGALSVAWFTDRGIRSSGPAALPPPASGSPSR